MCDRVGPSVKVPEAFSFTPDDWKKWIERFELYRMISGLDRGDPMLQVNTLLYVMGEKSGDILTSFKLPAAEKSNYDLIVRRFNEFFVPARNIIYERARFLKRKQLDSESAEEFVMQLHKLSSTCELGNLEKELILMVFVIGLRDQALSDKIMLTDEMTLEKAVNIVRSSEELLRQKDVLTDSKPLLVDAVKKDRFHKTVNGKCKWCGYSTNHFKNQCPAKSSRCNHCKKIGHFAAVCNSRAVNTVEEDLYDGKYKECNYVGNIESNSSSLDPWVVDLQINGHSTVKFKLDTGSDVTLIPADIKLAQKIPIFPSTVKLFGPTKTPLKVRGHFKATLTHKKNEIKETVYVVENAVTPLLGRISLRKLGILKFAASIEQTLDPIQAFKNLFSGLGKMTGKTYTIELKPGAKPYALSVPRAISLPLLDETKKTLEKMIKEGTIKKVNDATEWCAPIVVVPKKDSKEVRICIDFTKLNENVKRPYYPIPKISTSLAKLNGATIFSKLDANSGFYQIPLTEKCQNLTTFITPFGRFKFLVLPFGITSAPEVFQRAINEVLEGIEGVIVHMDDVLVFGKTKADHDLRLTRVLQAFEKEGMTLNKQKCQFHQTSLKFLGHVVSEQGIQPDPDRIRGITQMKAPSTVKEVQQFLGVINYVSQYIPRKSELLEPIHCLLKKETHFIWDEPQQQAFDKVKRCLTESPCLSFYDPCKHTIISCDASSYGLGAVLYQKEDKGERKVVAYISRTLSEAEKRYANIEREALAITWACEKLKDFLLGKQFVIETDHKPLLQLLKTKGLGDLTLRLQRLRMRLMWFDYKIDYIPGKNLITADFLSRQPVTASPDDFEVHKEVELYVSNVINSINKKDVNIQKVWEAQKNDSTLCELKQLVLTGWPDKGKVPLSVKKYFPVKDELTVIDDVILRGSRLIIPEELRNEILGKLHEGHMGITKTRRRAQTSVWWPGLSTEIEDKVRGCDKCIENSQNHHEPLIPGDFPTHPWDTVGIDLFKLDKTWFIVIHDLYSRYFESASLSNLTAAAVIKSCQSTFSRHGIPREVRSDCGTQFISSSEFKKFSQEYGFNLVTSSPYFKQSNGAVEAAVKIAKCVLKKCPGDPYRGLLAYRNTPLANGLSPAQLLMGRKLRDVVPTVEPVLQERICWDDIRKKESNYRKAYKENYDRHHRTTPLPPLNPNQSVWITDLKRYGKVKEKCAEPRSYLIETDKRVVRRNRFHLIPSRKEQERVSQGQEEVSHPVPEESHYAEIEVPDGLIHSNEDPEKQLPTDDEKEDTQDGEKSQELSVSSPIRTRSGRVVRRPKKFSED